MPREERPEPPQNTPRRVAETTGFRSRCGRVLAVLADGQYHAGLLNFF
jgi:hypothetical protein